MLVQAQFSDRLLNLLLGYLIVLLEYKDMIYYQLVQCLYRLEQNSLDTIYGHGVIKRGLAPETIAYVHVELRIWR